MPFSVGSRHRFAEPPADEEVPISNLIARLTRRHEISFDHSQDRR
jgi:hypothetical protein